MSLSTQRRGQLGVNVVERIVIKDWNARWQQIDAHNDDGVDGLIFLERGGKMTGQVIFVQVKCLRISVGKDNMFRVPIDAESLREKLEMWSRVAGAAILVLVDPQTLKACWQSLKDARFTTPTQILVWAARSFDKNSKRQIQIGCGTLNRDLSARTVYSKAEDFEHLLSPLHIQVSSRQVYKDLRQNPPRMRDDGPEVIFDRTGWRHITRPGRAQLTRYQSFVSLGCLRRFIQQTPLADFKPFFSQANPEGDLVAARAVVQFPFRQTAVVKVVLQVRKSLGQEANYVFYTVYEPRRRRTLLGARGTTSLYS